MVKEKGMNSSNRAKEIVAYKKLLEDDFDSAAKLYEKAGKEEYANLIKEYGPRIKSAHGGNGGLNMIRKLRSEIHPPIGAKYTSWWKMKDLQEDAEIKSARIENYKAGHNMHHWKGPYKGLIEERDAQKKLGKALLAKGREKGAIKHLDRVKEIDDELDEYRDNKTLGDKLMLIGAIISVLASFFLLTLNITGNVIGELSQNRSGSLGIILLLLGILGFFAYAKR